MDIIIKECCLFIWKVSCNVCDFVNVLFWIRISVGKWKFRQPNPNPNAEQPEPEPEFKPEPEAQLHILLLKVPAALSASAWSDGDGIAGESDQRRRWNAGKPWVGRRMLVQRWV
jgi:hypothetical protein